MYTFDENYLQFRKKWWFSYFKDGRRFFSNFCNFFAFFRVFPRFFAIFPIFPFSSRFHLLPLHQNCFTGVEPTPTPASPPITPTFGLITRLFKLLKLSCRDLPPCRDPPQPPSPPLAIEFLPELRCSLSNSHRFLIKSFALASARSLLTLLAPKLY